MWHLLSCSLVSIKEAQTSLSWLIWLAKYDTFFHYHVDILMSVLLKSKASSVFSYAMLGGLSWSQDWMGKEPSEYSPASTQILDGEPGQGATSRRWDDHLTTDWKSNEISGPRTARNPLIYHDLPSLSYLMCGHFGGSIHYIRTNHVKPIYISLSMIHWLYPFQNWMFKYLKSTFSLIESIESEW